MSGSPILTLIAALLTLLSSASTTAANVTAGKQIYNQCIGCHSFSYHRTGPKHCGLFERLAGSLEDFEYSEAMRESDIIWNTQTLDEFLASPLQVVPGTTMGFVGISSEAARADLISYIKAQASSAQCESQASQ